MKDYSAMSDSEINMAVANYLKRKGEQIINPYKHRPDVQIFHSNGLYSHKDYCNHPADAWPIIVENAITVACSKKINSTAWDSSKGLAYGAVAHDQNPLRAAMIVFLMMKDAENGN